ncbi:hypothetical protein O6H91_02G076300 [Diphasiastrum complanatum]|uniref:Uncharacterized protein n=1 Tax=Diphasiastrum complanatum TaxID=34168 RepID=A0ACC2EHB1_DIPCM|nr:hypothetical protein O6H91_02G076300 [Diphasiastrum complanatum]
MQPCLEREYSDDDESLIGAEGGDVWRDQVRGNLDDYRPVKGAVKTGTGSVQQQIFYGGVDDWTILQSPLQTAHNSIYPGHAFPISNHSQVDPTSCRQQNPQAQNNIDGVSVPEVAQDCCLSLSSCREINLMAWICHPVHLPCWHQWRWTTLFKITLKLLETELLQNKSCMKGCNFVVGL